MTHRIHAVNAKENYVIEAVFNNGDVKQYDMKSLFITFLQFLDFKKVSGLFEKVRVDMGGYGISWNDELDLDAETIWEDGILIETSKKSDLNPVKWREE